MVDKTMLQRKIAKVNRILGEIEEDQGTNNKLYRAYQRKIDRYTDLLEDDHSEEDSVLRGSSDEASILSPPQSQDIDDIESDAESENDDQSHDTESEDDVSEAEEEAPKKKKKKKKKPAEDGEEVPKKKKKKKKKPVDGEEKPKLKKKKKKKPKEDE